MSESKPPTEGVVGRISRASVSLADKALSFNPQPGMWAATGTAIAYAPTLIELREPFAGGDNIEFDVNGHSSRTVTTDASGLPVLNIRLDTLSNCSYHRKGGRTETTANGFKTAFIFISTPTGFLMTIYGLNIVAWGAMLFFLLLGAAPAMNHLSKDSDASPRKIWLEIDSQILNALFCVTGFGLAPWRFRDLWWLIRSRTRHNRYAMGRLVAQNKAWFRPPAWFHDSEDGDLEGGEKDMVTFTGETAPPTALWRLSFVVWMMTLNTLFQGALAGFMWGYNRLNRYTWARGAFIGLVVE